MLAVAMMRRPGNRGRLLLLVAGAPADDQGFHELGVRPAAHYLGTGTGHVHNLLRQLVSGSVLERRAGAGSRPDSWRFRPEVDRWAVEWSRAPDHVRLTLLDAGHVVELVDAKPGVAFTSMSERRAQFARAFMGERSSAVAFTNRGERKGSGLRAPLEVNANGSSSSSDEADRGGRRKRSEEVEQSPFVAELSALVMRRTGRPVFGAGVDRLSALDGRLSLDDADRTLMALPSDAGFGMVLAALGAAAGPANGHRPSIAAVPTTRVWEPEPFDEPDPGERDRVRSLLGAVRRRDDISGEDGQ